jgi:DinB superfamily
MNRPDATEYAPYYERYISLVPDDDIQATLAAQKDEISSLVSGLPEEKGTYAYADGKWTVKELLSHVIDGERIFSYRALRISRGDKTPIEGFEQDDYIANSNANNRSFADLVDEFTFERAANLRLFANFTDENSKRVGTASDNPVSARAIAYIMAGHVRHHIGILKERYLT